MSRSLHETEQALFNLWMDEETRVKFLARSLSTYDALEEQIDARGVKLYASLLKLGQRELMLSVFPYCAQVIGAEWEATVSRYLSCYPTSHYNLNKTASRFPEYLACYEKRYIERYPYLPELADYEWVELEILEMDKEIEVGNEVSLHTPSDFARFAPIVNPVLVTRSYEYAITRIVEQLEAHGRLPKKGLKHKTELAFYRHPKTNRCRFLEVGATALKIIERASSQTLSYAELLAFAIKANHNKAPENIACEFLELVEKFKELFVFIGEKTI